MGFVLSLSGKSFDVLLLNASLVKQSEAAGLFNTKQSGVAVKAGVGGIVHTTRISFEKVQKSKNSEYSVKRSKVLVAVGIFLLSVAPFETFCYPQHSHLHFNNTHLSSQSGVQQGHPLGPLLFSLALANHRRN